MWMHKGHAMTQQEGGRLQSQEASSHHSSTMPTVLIQDFCFQNSYTFLSFWLSSQWYFGVHRAGLDVWMYLQFIFFIHTDI